MMAEQTKFPATKTVHWPSGPTEACEVHAAQLVGLGRILGSHVGVSEAPEGAECANCANEAKAKATP